MTRTKDEIILGVVLILACAGLLVYAVQDMILHTRESGLRKTWCNQVCGAQRVLVCQDVSDPAWSKNRRAVGCMVDPKGHEVRFVIEEKP